MNDDRGSLRGCALDHDRFSGTETLWNLLTSITVLGFLFLCGPALAQTLPLVFSDDFASGDLSQDWTASPAIEVAAGRVSTTFNGQFIETILSFAGDTRIEVDVEKLGPTDHGGWDFAVELTSIPETSGIIRFDTDGVDGIAVGPSPSIGGAFGDQVTIGAEGANRGTAILSYSAESVTFSLNNASGQVLTAGPVPAGVAGTYKIRIHLAAHEDTPRFIDNVKVYGQEPAAPPHAEPTILARARIGNFVEDLTYVDRGPNAKRAVVIDGWEARGVKVAGKGRGQVKTLFDLRDLGGIDYVNGMAWIESEKRFALVDGANPGVMVVTDHKGKQVEEREIVYLGGFFPDWLEGLAYLPADAVHYPDHLALVAITNPAGGEPFHRSRIVILDRGGQAVAEIIPDEGPVAQGWGLGLTHFAPDRLLVWDLYQMLGYFLDFDGTVSGPVLESPSDRHLEGLAQLPDGRVMGTSLQGGKLFLFDEDLEHLTGLDRSYLIEPGVSRADYVGWDGTRDELLVVELDFQRLVQALPEDLGTAEPVIDIGIGTRCVMHLPDEDRIAVIRRNTSEILLFDRSGLQVETIDLSAHGLPNYAEYIPAKSQWVVRFSGMGSQMVFFDRDGTYSRTLDLAGDSIFAAFFAYFDEDHPTGGRFVVFDRPTVYVIDFDGVVLGQFDAFEELGILQWADLIGVTSGARAGSIAFLARNHNEVLFVDLD